MHDEKNHQLVQVTTVFGSLVLLLLLILSPHAVTADEVIMTTGETFSSSKVWEENGKIRFNMHGLIVSVDRSEVAQIIRKQKSPQSMHKPNRPQKKTSAAPLRPHAPETPVHAKPAFHKPANSPKIAESSQRKKKDQTRQLPAVSGVGLQGITWQLKPTDLPGLIKVETDPMYGGIDQYYRENEIMKLGPAALDGKVYGFWRNRLYMITIWAEGSPAYKRLRKAVFERYGRGKQNSEGLERYVWDDPTTERMLEFDEKLNTGLFWMRSRVLDKKIKLLYKN